MNANHNPNNLLSFSTLFREYSEEKYKHIPEGILKRAAEFGKAVHFIIGNQNTIDPDELTPQELLCLESFKRETKDFQILENEVLFENFELGIMGWIDLIAKHKNNKIPYLIEIKTRSKIEKNICDYGLEICQLVFYSLLYPQKTRLLLLIINKNTGVVLKHKITKKQRRVALQIIRRQISSFKNKKKILEILTNL